jgi:hypothetical protein
MGDDGASACRRHSVKAHVVIGHNGSRVGDRDYDATVSIGERFTNDEFAGYLRAELDGVGL